MRPTAKVYRHPRSPYFQAWFLIWDTKAEGWKPCTKSTKCTSEAKALAVAQEFERVALAAAGKTGDSRITREYALQAVNDILRLSGHHPIEETRSWKAYAASWLALREPPRAAPKTYLNYKSSLSVFAKWLGKRESNPLTAFTGEDLQAWYHAMLAEGRKPRTVNFSLQTIRAVFDRAREEGFCSRNPAALVVRQFGEDRSREEFTAEDLTKLLRHIRQHEPAEWLTVTLFGLCTGQRLGDCARAQWTHLEHTGNGWVWHLTQGKTKKKLDVPIVEPLSSHLTRLANGDRSALAVAPTLFTHRVNARAGLSIAFTKIIDRAGIEGLTEARKGKGRSWRSKSFHSLRHTCNSILANAGVSQDVRRLILGHASEAMNTRYTHMQVETSRAALAALERAVNG